MGWHAAIMGATGAVGTEFLRILEQRDFPLASLKLLASQSLGRQEADVPRRGADVEELTEKSFDGVELVLASAGGSLSRSPPRRPSTAGAVVVDNTSAFRMDPDVPLVVPEVNPEDIAGAQGHHRQPELLDDHHERAGLAAAQGQPDQADRRQHLPGRQRRRGTRRWSNCEEQARDVLDGEPFTPKVLPHQARVQRLQPQLRRRRRRLQRGRDEDGQRDAQDLPRRPTSASPPPASACRCMRAHSEAINLEFAKPITEDEVREILAAAPGVTIVDDREKQLLPHAAGRQRPGRRARRPYPPGHVPAGRPRHRHVRQRRPDPQGRGPQRRADRRAAEEVDPEISGIAEGLEREADASGSVFGS